MSSWYVLQNNQQYGPFDSEQLRSLAMTGRLFRWDHVRLTDAQEWTQAGMVPGLIFSVAVANQPQRADFFLVLQKLIAIGGGLVIVLMSLAFFGQLKGSEKSAKALRDFGDNTANYKGKTLTFKLVYDGPPLNPLLRNGAAPIQLDPTFRAAGFIDGNYFHFDMHLTIPENSKVLPLNSGDDVNVTFECTKGNLQDGNIVKKIVRP